MLFRLFTAGALALSLIGTASAVHAANLTVDGSQKFQTIGGVGVNVNVNSWNGGELRPALDLLVDTHGSSVMRVIRDPIAWVGDEATIPSLHTLDAATLAKVYEAPAMQDIWAVIAYLNQKGLSGDAIMLNFMGWTPPWLGGSGGFGVPSHITASKNGAWATMVASLVYYGRQVKKLDFRLLGPLNEADLNCLEGPCLAPAQYTSALQALIDELDGMGQNDVRLVGPDCAGPPGAYLDSIRANATVLARIDHIALHQYGGAASPGPAIDGHDYWLTEMAASCGGCDTGSTPSQGEWAFARDSTTAALGGLANGLAGILVYDGYDSFYFHHNSFGYWGLASYDSGAHAYAARKRLYANAQIAKFVRPGMVRVRADDTVASLATTIAFLDAASGAVTIVGYNDDHGDASIMGQLSNVPSIASLALFLTNPSSNLERGADVAVSANQFSVTIPRDTIFTLTSAPAGAGPTGVTSAGSSTTGGGSQGAATTGGGAGTAMAEPVAPASKSCGCNSSGARASTLGGLFAVLAFAWRRDRRRRG